MALGRNPLADRVAAHAGSDLDDAADEFMADHQPGLDRALAPLVPQVDVQVRTADGGFLELDQDLVRARLRDRDLLHPDALGRFALDQRLHGRGNLRGLAGQDRKSTRLNPVTNAPLVCRLLLEIKKMTKMRLITEIRTKTR